MGKLLDVIVADSSGNITIMVLTPTDRKDYKDVAQILLNNKGLGGEQVAFILPPAAAADVSSKSGISTGMEMCGLEFCGNASRAFALYEARRQNLLENGFGEVSVSVSGCDHVLDARIYDAEGLPGSGDGGSSFDFGAIDGIVDMDMPIPLSSRVLSGAELGTIKDGLLVDIDGISHLILEDVAPSADLFESIRHRIYESVDPDLPALGVMFCDTVNRMMTPVVYVKDVDSTYFEGSCASGSVAASYALAEKLPDGVHEFTLQQPEGALYTSVTKEKDRIERITLKGLVDLSEPMQIQI